MKKTLHLFFIGAAILFAQSLPLNAQFTFSDVKYWIGTGSDTSVLVVDFNDATWDTSYAWGYLHNAGATGLDMLNAIAAADVNFDVSAGGGFLNHIVYGSHSGTGGNPDFWSTWSGTDPASMSMNGGVSTPLTNGDWFGCSYTDFNPALAPGIPIPAFDPLCFTAQDVKFWVGNGTDTTLLVIDFLNGTETSSFAWGYRHSGGVTAEQMLLDISAADPTLTINTGGGFLNDISYISFSCIGGNPDFWGTWSASNSGNWDMNNGISTVIGNGDMFGCSYMNFSPPVRPNCPKAATLPASIDRYQQNDGFHVYPNPTSDIINISFDDQNREITSIKIFDATGKLVADENTSLQFLQIPLHELPEGLYNVIVYFGNKFLTKHFIKK